MNIAYLSTFPPFRGGISQFNVLFTEELERQNHTVIPYTFTTQYPDILFPGTSQMLSKEEMQTSSFLAPRLLSTVNPLTYIPAANEIVQKGAQLLCMKYWMPFFSPSLGSVSRLVKKQGVTPIAIIDNAIPHEKRFGDNALTNYFFNSIEHAIVMSQKVYDDVKSIRSNLPVTLCEHPLYDQFGEGIDKETAKKQFGIPANKKVLLFFGFIRDYKGLDLLLQTVSELPEEYHLLIAGEVYGSFEQYDKIIAEQTISNRCTKEVRYIDDKEVPAFFSAADAVVLPYKTGTQSGIISIAYHFNVPVIATNVGGLSEMILPYETGVVVPTATTNDVKNGILNLFTRHHHYVEGISRYKETHTWSYFTSNVIESVLGSL
jgi:glycosyltransferase involved in cell wall biosynthesis